VILLCYNGQIMKNKTFIFLGRSGCGKGTQVKLLIDELAKQNPDLQTIHIESGTLLREFAPGDTFTQKKTKFAIENGILAPEAVIVSLWMNRLTQSFTGVENLVFDGAPRKLREAQLLNDTLRFFEIEKPNVICVNVSRDWAEKRLVGRARKDDTVESINRRLAWYETDVLPVVDYYKSDPYYNVIEINGEQSIEEVQSELLAKLGLNR